MAKKIHEIDKLVSIWSTRCRSTQMTMKVNFKYISEFGELKLDTKKSDQKQATNQNML